MTRAEHIRQLCQQYGVRKHVGPSGTGEAWCWLDDPYFKAPVVRSLEAYYIALHELGHCVLKHPRRSFEDCAYRVLRTEGEAWLWALDHAMEPPDERLLQKNRTDWMGYYQAIHVPKASGLPPAWREAKKRMQFYG